MPAGARARLGGQALTVGESAAYLQDGTLAGSVLTMDRAFKVLVERIGFSLVDAAAMCSTTPAREFGLVGHGVLAVDAVDDLLHLRSGREPGVDARRVRVAARVEGSQVDLQPPDLGQSPQ